MNLAKSSGFSEVKSNRSRKKLQVLQVSAYNPNILVPSPSLLNKNEKKKILLDKDIATMTDICGKENDCTIRKSKRKNVVSKEVCSKEELKKGTVCSEEIACSVRRSKRKNVIDKVIQKEASKEGEIMVPQIPKLKTSKPASTSKKVSSKKTKKQIPVDAQQPKIDSFIAASSTSSKTSEPSEEISDSALSKVESTICHTMIHSISDETDYLTSSSAVGNYWRDLAEERRIALAAALEENVLVWDELKVLEEENAQLKSCLKDAEKMAEMLESHFNSES